MSLKKSSTDFSLKCAHIRWIFYKFFQEFGKTDANIVVKYNELICTL